METARNSKTTRAVYDFLSSHALSPTAPSGEVNLTLDEIASGIGKTRRMVSFALDNLSSQGLVLERKPRKIRIQLPEGPSRSKLRGEDFSGRDLSGEDFTGADLVRANLAGANLEGARLGFANLSMADMSGCNLKDATLRNAMLCETNLQSATLENTVLRRAKLYGTDFTDAQLSHIDAHGSRAFDPEFHGARVEAFELDSPLQPGSLWKSVTLESTQLRGFVGLAHTHSLLALLVDETMSGNRQAPFVSCYIETERYGCWEEGLSRIALEFPQFFVSWINRWREPDIDNETRITIEQELGNLSYVLEGEDEAQFWSELLEFPLPRVWRTCYRIQRDSALAGENRTKKKLSFLTKNDVPKVAQAVEKAKVRTPADIASMIEQLFVPSRFGYSENLPAKYDVFEGAEAAG